MNNRNYYKNSQNFIEELIIFDKKYILHKVIIFMNIK